MESGEVESFQNPGRSGHQVGAGPQQPLAQLPLQGSRKLCSEPPLPHHPKVFLQPGSCIPVWPSSWDLSTEQGLPGAPEVGLHHAGPGILLGTT